MPKRSASDKEDGDGEVTHGRNPKRASLQAAQTNTKRSGSGASDTDAKRTRTDKSGPLAVSTSSSSASAEYEAELADRRKMPVYKDIVLRAFAERLRPASEVGQAVDGSFFGCLFNQIEALKVKSDFPSISEPTDILLALINFVTENGSTQYQRPRYTDDLSDSDGPRTGTPKKSQTLRSMTSDKFFELLKEEQPPPVNALALFGCTNALGIRIAVLLPSTCKQKWEVWEPLARKEDMHTFYVARIGKQCIFESLLEREDGASPVQELSEDDTFDEAVPPEEASPASIEHCGGRWVRCTRKDCQKVRFVVGEASEIDEKSWTCDQNTNAAVENACKDADIWNQVHCFWKKVENLKKRKTAFRTVGGKLLAINEFFIAVQVMASLPSASTVRGSFNALRGKATELALKLGGESLQASSAASRFRTIYDEVFVELRQSVAGGGTLEHLLLHQPAVQTTIAAHTSRILLWLNIQCDEMPSAPAAPKGRDLRGVLPVVFQKTAQKQLSTDQLHRMLQQFSSAAMMFPADTLLSPLGEVQAAVDKELKRGGGLQELMLHGETGAVSRGQEPDD